MQREQFNIFKKTFIMFFLLLLPFHLCDLPNGNEEVFGSGKERGEGGHFQNRRDEVSDFATSFSLLFFSLS